MSRTKRHARSAAGLTVALTALAVIAIWAVGSAAIEQARQMWGDQL